MSSLEGKVVVVTGSTRGFGLASAAAFSEAGATVAITGRSPEALDRALNDLQPRESVRGFLLDVREESQAYRLVEQVNAAFGHIDVWINNAGYSNAAGRMLDMNPQDALEMFRANDLGLLYCTQAVLHDMLPRRTGLVVNIYGNGSFLRPASPTGLYGATKAWVSSFTRSLAVELKGSGVRLLGFSPGMLTTDMLTHPVVVGDYGREILKNYGFVLRLLSRPPEAAAQALVKAVASSRREFEEVRLFKPWTPLLGLLRLGLENLTGRKHEPKFELDLQPAYRSKFLK